MSTIARITVTAGPDAGREFVIQEELVHIGRGEENHFSLSEPEVAEHQASVAHKSGRFAIYSPLPSGVRVDGNELPAEKWVWLPSQATIRVGEKTELLFRSEALHPRSVEQPPSGAAADVSGMPAASSSAPSESVSASATQELVTRSGTASRRKSGKSSTSRQIAKFITDQPGDPLVRLGEDGKLPELRLSERTPRSASRGERSTKNPLILYGVLAFSFVLSLGLILINPAPPTVTSSAKEAARLGLVEYFGQEGMPLERYQQLLRQAHIDHSRGNYESERRAYREVLRILNSADIVDPSNLNGLTGKQTGRGRSSDEELRRLLQVLLAR